MKLAVFGASGRTGQTLVRQALAQGHEVSALVRDPAKLVVKADKLRTVQGDVLDATKVAEAVRGADAVLSVLGPSRSSPKDVLTQGMTNILNAMRENNVRRIIMLTGAGVSAPGDPPSAGRAVMGTLLKLMAKDVLQDSENQTRLVTESDLDWTVVRVPRLADGPHTGAYRHGTLKLGMSEKIARADVADFMLKQLSDDNYVQKLPMVSY